MDDGGHAAEWDEFSTDVRKKDQTIRNAILAGVLIGLVLVGLHQLYFGSLRAARIESARIQAMSISKALASYRDDHEQELPKALQELLVRDANGKGPYLFGKDSLTDPWGLPFQYCRQGVMHRLEWPLREADVFTFVPENGRVIGNWKE